MIGQHLLLASKVGHAKELLATDTDQQAKICPALPCTQPSATKRAGLGNGDSGWRPCRTEVRCSPLNAGLIKVAFIFYDFTWNAKSQEWKRKRPLCDSCYKPTPPGSRLLYLTLHDGCLGWRRSLHT